MTVQPYYYSPKKRIFDLLISTWLLIFLLPLFLVISLLIFLTAGWPIFFTQKRLGKDNKPFFIFKFRVMYVGAEKNQFRYRQHNQAPEPMYKFWEDPRYVGLGKWLAKTGLDELPQLINIIKGEMSLVGPRPLPVAEAKKLGQTWNFRFQVKPGIFSEWSHSPQRHHSLNIWKKLEKDTLKNGGWVYDLMTILKTLISVFA